MLPAPKRGDRCANGQRRSASLELRCAERDELVSADEVWSKMAKLK